MLASAKHMVDAGVSGAYASIAKSKPQSIELPDGRIAAPEFRIFSDTLHRDMGFGAPYQVTTALQVRKYAGKIEYKFIEDMPGLKLSDSERKAYGELSVWFVLYDPKCLPAPTPQPPDALRRNDD